MSWESVRLERRMEAPNHRQQAEDDESNRAWSKVHPAPISLNVRGPSARRPSPSDSAKTTAKPTDNTNSGNPAGGRGRMWGEDGMATRVHSGKG